MVEQQAVAALLPPRAGRLQDGAQLPWGRAVARQRRAERQGGAARRAARHGAGRRRRPQAGRHALQQAHVLRVRLHAALLTGLAVAGDRPAIRRGSGGGVHRLLAPRVVAPSGGGPLLPHWRPRVVGIVPCQVLLCGLGAHRRRERAQGQLRLRAQIQPWRHLHK